MSASGVAVLSPEDEYKLACAYLRHYFRGVLAMAMKVEKSDVPEGFVSELLGVISDLGPVKVASPQAIADLVKGFLR